MKKYLVISLFCLSALSLSAQYSMIYSSADALYVEGVQLYEQGQWNASLSKLTAYTGQTYSEEAVFYRNANLFELRDKSSKQQLASYIASHPYTPYASEVHYMQGVLLVEQKKAKQALKELEQVNEKELFRSHQAEYLFYRGYAHLEQKEPQKASLYFGKLKEIQSPYTLQARYYYAFCQYTVGNYGKALPEFLAIEHTAQYKDIVPYYIIQIYYAQQQYDEVYERAEYLLSHQPKNENNPELHRMLGEIYYQESQYDKAVEHLSEYEKVASGQKKQLVRNDMYLLGMSYYQLQQYENAIRYLNKIKKEEDALTENTCYHLGNAYQKTGQPEQAKMAYSTVLRIGKDETLREEAMYNYALTTYQSSSALGESVNAFTEFLNTYPQSRYREQVYALLCDVFMSSKNYAAALESAEKISNPSSQMRGTMQYLRYQLGSDAYMQGQYKEAEKWLTEVISNPEPSSSSYVTESYYLRAECAYKEADYAKSEADLKSFLQQTDSKKSSNYNAALYAMAYTQFAQKRYADSRSSFERFVETEKDNQSLLADALNRIGDCYFNQRDFVKAESYYAKVIAMGSQGADYALFQRGYALGLLKKHSDKVNVLQKLVKQYPKSDYADDALYEMARAYLQLNNNDAAIRSYERLLSQYPHSNKARKAALEKGMIYYNQQNYTKAIESYKQVIKNYPGSEEAYSALDGLESAYVETNNVSEYIAYTKQLGKQNMKIDSKEDSLTFVAAERQYILQNYQQAVAGLSKYLSQYCDGGRYCTMAQYYAADSYYRLGQKKEALEEYDKLSSIAGNPYMEEALTRAAEITYDEEDYNRSLAYFKRLQTIAGSIATMNMARLGVLRCSYYLKDNMTTINVASQILEDVASSAEVQKEARYNRAKAYYALSDLDLAEKDFSMLSEEVRTQAGAESKYMVCLIALEKKEIDRSEAEIMSFAGMNTQHQYWLAKSFILLADIYLQRGDTFQAKQYLLSLKSNYRNTEDGIHSEVNEKLQLIEDREKETVKDEENEED